MLELIHSKKDESTMRGIVKASGNYTHDQLTNVAATKYADKETLENLSYINETSVFKTDLCSSMLNAAESLMYLVNENSLENLISF